MTDLAHRLKTRRLQLGLSQNALAQKCGVSQPTIANWERGGHVPRRATLDGIATCLEVDPIWLLSGEQPAHLNPAHQHLSRPIHQIPIYAWPRKLSDLGSATAVRYVSLSADGGDLLGLEASECERFPAGTILIFDRAETERSGCYLTRSGDNIELSDVDLAANDMIGEPGTRDPEQNLIARLKLSLQPH